MKSKNINNILQIIRYFFPPVVKHFPAYLVLGFTRTAIDAVKPLINVITTPLVIDELMGERSIQRLVIYTAIIVLGNCIPSLFSSLLMRCMIKFDASMDNFFSLRLSRKVMEMDFRHTESKEALDQLQAAKNGYPNYSGGVYTMSIGMFSMLSSGITIAGVVAIIAMNAPVLFVIIAVAVVLNAFMMSRINKLEVAHNMSRSKRDRIFSYFAFKLTDFRFGKDIRLYNASEMMLSRWNSYRDGDIADHINEANKTVVFWAGRGFVNAIRNLLSNLYLGILAATGRISIGIFSQMITSGFTLNTAMESLMLNYQNVAKSCSYAVEYIRFMDYPDALQKGNRELDIKDHIIEFKDVSFAYPGSDVKVLDKINLTLTPGEHLSVVGLNGAGKTTFVKLMCRLYDPTEGEILLDGVNIKEFDYDTYMEMFSPVFQDFKLFAATVKENVVFDRDVPDSQVDELLEKVGLKAKVDSLAKGKDTLLFKAFDENGIEPSGGEQQKLAIARALFKNAPIVILDEPTAALDPVAEYEIYKQFDSLVGNRAAIYISHRLSSCKFCHKIAVFGEGRVAEYGTHEELVNKKDGIYAEMFAAQSQYYN